jgi:hypothetical protein
LNVETAFEKKGIFVGGVCQFDCAIGNYLLDHDELSVV